MAASLATRTYTLSSEGHEIATFELALSIKPGEVAHDSVTLHVDAQQHFTDLAAALREVADNIDPAKAEPAG